MAKPVPPVVVKTDVVYPAIPADVLACAVPTPTDIARDSDVADYMVQLHAAAMMCARNAEAVRAIVHAR